MAPDPFLLATITVDRLPALAAIVARLRHLFDLDADPDPIAAHLGRDPVLAPRLAHHAGLRVPGAWDSFELAVQAMLEQRVGLAAASALTARLAATFGERISAPRSSNGGLRLLFPDARTLARADLSSIGLPRARAAALSALATLAARESAFPRTSRPLEHTTAELRALRAPDAVPAGDVGLLRAMRRDMARTSPALLERRAERWRPWRAYAAMLLWLDGADAS